MSLIKNIKRELTISRKEKSILIYIGLIINMVCAGIIPFITIILNKEVIDCLENKESISYIIKLVLFLCLTGVLCEVISSIIVRMFKIAFIDIRLKEYNKVNQMYLDVDYKHIEDAKFNDSFKVAAFALVGDNIGFQNILTVFMEILPIIFSTIIYIIVVGKFNLLILLSVILSSIIVVFINKKIANYISSKKEKLASAQRKKDYFSNVAYDFSYGKDIRVLSLNDNIKNHYNENANVEFSITKNIARKRYKLGLLEILLLFLEDACAYFFIIKGFYDGEISIALVSMYITSVTLLSESFRILTDKFGSLIKDSKYVDSYFEFMDNYSNYQTAGELDSLTDTLEIEFKNVSFKYPNTDKWILKNFNFKINKGEHLAIVGTNGAGKSTIVKLICGLFFPNEGEILINGCNIREFKKTELEKMFSVVYQDINIYAGNVLENIRGKDCQNDDKAIEVIKMVGLEEKIKSLPNGYQTSLLKVIDNDGIELSGGQNQKLAIARALYKNGNMVILDEPTSALDAMAEASIYSDFNKLVKDKTAIYISHRLSSTKFCDKIALFTNEGLKEYGTHDELMKLKGEYYNMFIIQGKYYKEGGKVNEEE